jgi:hypothetical protein
MTLPTADPAPHLLRSAWEQAWPRALSVWSRFVQLHDPTWCLTTAEERREQLSGSFAMIRLFDHSVVISLRQIAELELGRFALEILAHEVGHHVYCPADLADNARLLARTRAGLPTKELHAPLIANLYADLLINDRLQRSASLDIVGVYRQLGAQCREQLWALYMRMYEVLWRLDRGTLAMGTCPPRTEQDAQLGARVIRSYAKDWLAGAGRFAALCLPYLIEDEKEAASRALTVWCDTRSAGRGGLPDGLVEIDPGERDAAIHPAEDPLLSDLDDGEDDAFAGGRTPSELSGRKSNKTYRQPFEYREVLRAAGVELDDRALTARYYRERALPYLIRFPAREVPQTIDPLPEGLDVWDVGSPLTEVDWLNTLLASPVVVPGVTTRQRVYGGTPGHERDRQTYDLYLGVDCSGSMGDPARSLSYPVLAGAIIALSALRAGSRVKVVLSGEPGNSLSTDGFVRDEATVLRTLTSYLGTGYAFGIHRLGETFAPEAQRQQRRPVHVLIVSDHDMFSMLNELGSGRVGWEVAAEALARCRGGGTFVLQMAGAQAKHRGVVRLREEGWNVSLVNTLEELVTFAQQFSRQNYEEPRSAAATSRGQR